MNYQVDIEVTAPVYPTEVADRVERAVQAIFPDATIDEDADRIVAETHSVDRFRELLREQRILDTARSQLQAGRQGDSIEFALKKQAAFHETVNFSVGNPDELGEISVRLTVSTPSVDAFIEYLAPPTDDDGVPIEPSEND